MKSPATSVRSWAPVPADLLRWRESIARLRHFRTAFLPVRDRDVRRRGTTSWATDFEDSKVGLVWEWAELTGQVFVMVNPMAVVTNMTLLDNRGHPLAVSERACNLNAAIYSLPWQVQIANLQ